MVIDVPVNVVEIWVACPLMVVEYAVVTVVGVALLMPHRPEPAKSSAGYKTLGRPTPIGTLSRPLWSTVILVQVKISVICRTMVVSQVLTVDKKHNMTCDEGFCATKSLVLHMDNPLSS